MYDNKESILPQRVEGYYKEYVQPTPGIRGPGRQHIVIGGGNEWYYSPDVIGNFESSKIGKVKSTRLKKNSIVILW